MNTKLATMAIVSGIIAISGCTTTPNPNPWLDNAQLQFQARQVIAKNEVEIEIAAKLLTVSQNTLVGLRHYPGYVLSDELGESTKELINVYKKTILNLRTNNLPLVQTLVETTTGKAKILWKEALDGTNEWLRLSSEFVKTAEETLKLTSDNRNYQ